MTKEAYLNVNEIFGATAQGEGPHTGYRVAFLRVAGCNLSCVWCDTPYSWDWKRYDRSEESHPMTLQEIADEINKMGVNRIVVTGGEPMLQQRHFAKLQQLTGCDLDIETNGTVKPSDLNKDLVDLFCVSPKLSHAGDPEQQRIKTEVLSEFAELAKQGKAFFKFVAEKEEDFVEIEELIEKANLPEEHIWVMPEGADYDTHLKHLRELAQPIIDKGWQLSSRLHIIIWGTERGH